MWDARLTSVLVLFLLYLGVMALYWTAEDPGRGSRAAAVLSLVGAINLPIIKFSVDWWNTLHQPASIFRMGGSTIDPSILWPLLIMAVAFTLLFFTLHLAAMRNEILRRRVRTMRMMQAQEVAEARSMNLGPHADFIVAAYAVTVFVVAALIAWVVLDYSAQRRILGDLEERGVTRRSQRKGDR